MKFKEFEAEVSNQWEYKEFKDFLKLKRICHVVIVRDTPEQNGVEKG